MNDIASTAKRESNRHIYLIASTSVGFFDGVLMHLWLVGDVDDGNVCVWSYLAAGKGGKNQGHKFFVEFNLVYFLVLATIELQLNVREG